MARDRVRKDRVLFVDVEMTCWDGPPPTGQSPEIIEIGIAEVDVRRLVHTRAASFLVRPMRSSVSAACEALTGIRADDLKRRGRPLAEVARTLARTFGTGSKGWMSWGADKQAIDRDCSLAGIISPFSDSFQDIGFQFGALAGADKAVGLGDAMDALGVERRGRQHSGVDDAVALAELWVSMASGFRETIARRPRFPLSPDI